MNAGQPPIIPPRFNRGQADHRPVPRLTPDQNPPSIPSRYQPAPPVTSRSDGSAVPGGIPRRSAFAGRGSNLPPSPSQTTVMPRQLQEQYSQAPKPVLSADQLSQETSSEKSRTPFYGRTKNGGHRITLPLPSLRGAKRVKLIALLVVLILVGAPLAWGAWLYTWANGQIKHIDAISDQSATSGETWLVTGVDTRSDGSDGGVVQADVLGTRADSMILVRKVNGIAMVVSLPRDTAVEIPGHGEHKLNAAYAFGTNDKNTTGPKLLVATIEKFANIKIDHYVEVSMGGVSQVVDALGGVDLCWDTPRGEKIFDEDSGLTWESGCHQADGKTALAFARMRHKDPRGDFGRQDRQRQVLSQILSKAQGGGSYYNPFRQNALVKAAVSNVKTDPDTGLFRLVKMGLAYKSASASHMTGIPPIGNPAYRSKNRRGGLMVKLDPKKMPGFWEKFNAGTLSVADYHKF